MSDTAIFAVFLLLVAPVIGSFLGVLIDRLPRGHSVVWPGSACRDCGQRLMPRDLIPILSFALSRGRCRYCAASLPAWLLYVEIAATGAAVIAVILGGDMVHMAMIAGVLWLLLGLAVSDLLWFRLPDVMTGLLLILTLLWALIGMPTGAGATAADPQTALIWSALIGAALGAGSFAALRQGYWLLRGREGLGLGDVKLMAGLGALLGPWDLPLLVLLAALSALSAALIGALASGQWRAALQAARPLPFGAALAAAAAALWLLRLSGG